VSAIAEGFVPFRGYRTWYRVVGDREQSGKLPVLALHGGPGASYDYLEPLEAIAATGRRVIFYDQVGGAGRSDQPHDPSLWTVDLYKDELETVIRALGLGRYHLLGSSWGGMLAMEHALTQPMGLASLVIASSPASMRQWVDEANRLRADLPPDVNQTLLKHESAGTTSDAEYQEAMLVFYQRHVCRLDPWPDCVTRTFARLEQHPEVYNTMNGPSEFFVTGTLTGWDITHRLPEIRVPALVISGEFDEATPAINRTVHEGIAGSESVILDGCSHAAFVEKPAEYVAIVDGFLSRVEAAVPAFSSPSGGGKGGGL
jgi:L-proline amide hydrolase